MMMNMFNLGTNAELALSALFICAVSVAIPHDCFNWIGSFGFVCSDVAVLVAAAVAYWVLMSHRDASKLRPGLKTCKDVYADEDQVSETIREKFDVEGPTPVCHTECPATDAPEAENEQQQSNTDDCLALLEKFAAERNIKDALHTFRSNELSGASSTTGMYNAVLKTWISCGNIQAAEDWLDDAKEAGMADETSFLMLLKASVKSCALEKCSGILKEMKESGLQPSAAIYNECLAGFAEEGSADEGLTLLEEMHADGVEPNAFTFSALTKLVNGARSADLCFSRIQQLVHEYSLQSQAPSRIPRLAAVVLQAAQASNASHVHEVHVTGSLPRVKAARRSLKQDGYFDSHDPAAWPLDGFWETDHGLTVAIEGKMVRWSRLRASRLRFTGTSRRTCQLTIYGELARGRLVLPALVPGATKSLQWDNGDVWHAYECRSMGPITLSAQSMTKTSLDTNQDVAAREKSEANLRCVSTQGLRLAANLEGIITEFIGCNLYYFQVRFESKWNPSCMDIHEVEEDICVSLSRRHPCVGLRHCWAEQSADSCGQRALVNGDEVEEDCFNRHIKASHRS